jgi:transketolase C-terminal domain/subunit
MPDHFGESGEQSELIAKWGMDSKAIIAAVRKVVIRKK